MRWELLLLFSLFTISFISANTFGVNIGEGQNSSLFGVIIDGATSVIDSFLGLSDTPNSYTGEAGKCTVVNAGENALEFVACGGGGGGDFSFTDFQDSFDLNATGLEYNFNQSELDGVYLSASNEWLFNQSDLDLVYASITNQWLFNQSDITFEYNFNQSELEFNFNQSNLQNLEWLFNQSDLIYNFNQSDLPNLQFLFNQSDIIYNFNQSDLPNLQFLFNQSDLAYNFNQSDLTYNYNQSKLDSTYMNFTSYGDIDFNKGWTEGGISIRNGDLYAMQFFVYNISSLEVGEVSTNGSMIPSINNSFDLGNDTYNWKNGLFSGDIYISGIGSVSAWLFNQSDLGSVFGNFSYENFQDSFILNITEYNSTLLYEFNQSDLSDVFGNFSYQNFQDSFILNITEYNSTLLYEFNQSDLSDVFGNFSYQNFQDSFILNITEYNSTLLYEFNQSDLSDVFGNFSYQNFQDSFILNITEYNSTLDLVYSKINGSEQFWNVSGTSIFPQSLGYSVGIGTDTPNYALEINNNALGLNVSGNMYVNLTSVIITNSFINYTVGTYSDTVGANTSYSKLVLVDDAADNTAYRPVLYIFGQVSNEANVGGGYDGTSSSYGISFGRRYTNNRDTEMGGIYSYGSSGWKSGMLFRIATGFNSMSNAMIIDANGRIGISTLTPTHTLNVVGGANITGDLFSGDNNVTQWAFNQSAITYDFNQSDYVTFGTWWFNQTVNLPGTGDFNSTNFQDSFWLNVTDYNSTLLYEFNQSDYVTFGTWWFNQSNLDYNFNQSSLDSVYALTTNQWLFNQSAITYDFNQSSLDLVYGVVNGTDVTWNVSGTSIFPQSLDYGVGIGISAPAYLLEIANSVTALNVSGNLYANTSSVGIGTSNPTQSLTISGGNVQIDNNKYYRTKNAAGTEINMMGCDSANLCQGASTGAWTYHTNGGTAPGLNLLYLTSTGNVGIGGLTAPTQTLNVNGATNITGTLWAGNNTLYVNTSNVGIGTEDPESLLTIANDANALNVSGMLYVNSSTINIENQSSGQIYSNSTCIIITSPNQATTLNICN